MKSVLASLVLLASTFMSAADMLVLSLIHI